MMDRPSLRPSPNVSSSSIPTINYDTKRKTHFTVFPNIRETHFGETIGLRTKLQEALVSSLSNKNTKNDSRGINTDPIGSPDLIHWAKYYGATSNQFMQNDFTKKGRNDSKSANGNGVIKDDDGYIGYYHYANGLSFDYLHEDIEEYVLQLVGLETIDNKYYFKKEALASEKYSSNSKREMVVTYCTYNIFHKSDFRARFIIHLNGQRKDPIQIDKSYQVIPNNAPQSTYRKTLNYNHQTIKHLSLNYWAEIKVSQLIRLFAQLDNPANQLTGLVSYSSFLDTKEHLFGAIKSLVKYLGKGYMSGTQASLGQATTCGKGEKKTTHYRNNLVDTLLRLVQLDLSGEANQFAIEHIKSIWPKYEWDYVILKILKVTKNTNTEEQFLKVIHQHLSRGPSALYTTQAGLILQEQVKYLISKDAFSQALVIAQKSVEILPMDFECWYNLTLCYILTKDYERGLLMMNSLSVVIKSTGFNDIEAVSGIKDLFTSTFIHRLNQSEEVISEKTFKSYFPLPKVESGGKGKDEYIYEGSISKMWNDLFLFNQHLRHPINGNYFYQSPLLNCSAKEASSVDPQLIKLCGPSSIKYLFSSQSSNSLSSSILDYHRKSTWGRCYDLLSFFVAMVGWDKIVQLKEKVFISSMEADDAKEYVVMNGRAVEKSLAESKDDPAQMSSSIACETWLDQLFLVIYEDLRSLMVIISGDRKRQHSALEWEMLGLLGWGVKYNLEESISSLITSVMGTSVEGGFDYFGTVQILEIYDELVLSDVTTTSSLDLYHDDYDHKFFSNKLILKSSSNFYESFVKTLKTDYLQLEFVLLCVMRLISWDLRWYQYTPNYLIVKILSKLILKYDAIFVCTNFRVVFEKNKKSPKPKKSTTGIFSSFLKGESTDKKASGLDFVEEDTIFDYVERMVWWIESLREKL